MKRWKFTGKAIYHKCKRKSKKYKESWGVFYHIDEGWVKVGVEYCICNSKKIPGKVIEEREKLIFLSKLMRMGE